MNREEQRMLFDYQMEQKKVYSNKRALKRISEDAESCLAFAYGSLLLAEHETDHISNVRVNEISNIRRKLGRFLDELKEARASTDDIILYSRVSAELVLDRLYELLERFGVVTVRDLRELVGLPTTYLDERCGWTKFYASQTHILQTNKGYMLDLPPTESL
jgi:hypothetical protein